MVRRWYSPLRNKGVFMKFLILALALVSSYQAQADSRGRRHVINADWNDESVTNYRVDDMEEVIVLLPFNRYANPDVMDANPRNNRRNNCKFLGMKRNGSKFEFRFIMRSSMRDDGFNGCTYSVSRNLPNDEDGTGVVLVEFGYNIDN